MIRPGSVSLPLAVLLDSKAEAAQILRFAERQTHVFNDRVHRPPSLSVRVQQSAPSGRFPPSPFLSRLVKDGDALQSGAPHISSAV